MTKGEFCEFTEESGCVVEGNIIRNTINGRFTRLDDSFDESKDLHIVHHVCVLGIEPPDELEDLYNVYSPVFWSEVKSLE